MASKTVEICNLNVKPIIEEMGYEVLEIEFAKKQNGWNLSFIIDSPNGILIEDCEKVHKRIDTLLDEINPTNDTPYILNVCSPGLDRPLKTDNDFKKNLGKNVEIKLFSPLNNKKLFVGELCDFSHNTVSILCNDEKIELPKEKIANIVLEIKF